MTSQPLAAPESLPAPSRVVRAWRDLGYLGLSSVITWVAFIVAVTGLALGGSLLILVVGLPVLTVTAYAVAGLAEGERGLLRGLLRQPAPSPQRLPVEPGSSLMRQLLVPLRDPQTWLNIAWSLLAPWVSLVTGIIAFTWTVTALALATWPAYGWLGDEDPAVRDWLARFGMDNYVVRSLWAVVLGAALLVAVPWMARGLAAAQSGLSRLLLCSRVGLRAELTTVRERRDAARSAELGSLRRLERDIHDGPQQRLVRMGMDLGRAERLLADDPEKAREVVAQTRQMATDALNELRALSRGIAPPILVDRGLTAALEELATTSPIPVTLRVAPEADGLPDHLTHTAYFVAAEALTNAAKHSGATTLHLDLHCLPDRVVLQVEDDGIGGASLAKGHGLAGLQERVRGADGRLIVDSPAGGPTRILAVWP